jgi:hypothetical protein
MTIEAKTTALLGAIERRLTDISEQQHALAAERARLLEQLTPLRMGILAPDTAVLELKAKGITLRGLTAAWSAARHPRPAVFEDGRLHPSSRVPRPLTCSEIGHRGEMLCPRPPDSRATALAERTTRQVIS